MDLGHPAFIRFQIQNRIGLDKKGFDNSEKAINLRLGDPVCE